MAKSLCMLLLLVVSCSISPSLISGRSLEFSQEILQAFNEPDSDPTNSESYLVLVTGTSVILHGQEQTSLAAEKDEESFISTIFIKPLISLESLASILEENGLPIGLIPASVESYLVSGDGKFSVSLSKDCYVNFDYEVYYAETITGTLSYGAISNLSGIQAKKAFMWLSVTGIRVDDSSSNYIFFDVGPISRKLSISQFETVPVCRTKSKNPSAMA